MTRKQLEEVCVIGAGQMGSGIAQVKINQRKGSHEEALLQLNLILKIISSVDKKYPRHCLLKNRYLASLMPFLDCE